MLMFYVNSAPNRSSSLEKCQGRHIGRDALEVALITMIALIWGQLLSPPPHMELLFCTKHHLSVLHILTHLNS